MAELLITSSLDAVEEREIFPSGVSLPRHVTVWAYFHILDLQANEFVADIGNTVETFSPLQIEGAEQAMFGPNDDIRVRRVKAVGKGATLITLHSALGAVIEKHEGYITNPEWAHEGYKPHVTYKDGRALDENERAILNTVELIQKDPHSGSKFVRKVWNLEEA